MAPSVFWRPVRSALRVSSSVAAARARRPPMIRVFHPLEEVRREVCSQEKTLNIRLKVFRLRYRQGKVAWMADLESLNLATFQFLTFWP